MIEIRKAQRAKAPLKISLAGAPGSGKSVSSLLMARGMASSWDKIAVIDTENGSADLNSHRGDYNVITLTAPFTPDKYIEAIKACEQAGMEVIIIDSCTHVWSGQGGLLEYNSQLGGRYQDWAKTTPIYQRWLQAILESPLHIICTIRKKTHYEMSQEAGGKMKITKQGLEDQIRDGFEFEVTLALSLMQNNMIDTSIAKDRTGLFNTRDPFIITEETGREIKKWNESGIVLPPPDPYAKEKKEITILLKKHGVDITSKSACERYVLDVCLLPLESKHYNDIITRLIATPISDSTT